MGWKHPRAHFVCLTSHAPSFLIAKRLHLAYSPMHPSRHSVLAILESSGYFGMGAVHLALHTLICLLQPVKSLVSRRQLANLLWQASLQTVANTVPTVATRARRIFLILFC